MNTGILLEVQNPQQYTDIPLETELEQWANAAWLGKYPIGMNAIGEISVVLRIVNKVEGLQLNQAFRQQDKATNVLSFPFEIPQNIAMLIDNATQTQHLGDLVICKSVVCREAAAQNKSLTQHWAHLLIHGLLHLQGYDHIDSHEAEVMETLEVNILKGLNFPDPYQEL